MTQPQQLKQDLEKSNPKIGCCEKCEIDLGNKNLGIVKFGCPDSNCPCSCHKSPDKCEHKNPIPCNRNSCDGIDFIHYFHCEDCGEALKPESPDNSVESWKEGLIEKTYKEIENNLDSQDSFEEDTKLSLRDFLASSRSQVVENNILKLISSLVESDVGFESDSVLLDLGQGRDVSVREKTLAELVSKIYKIVHPLFSTCQHKDWEEETKDFLDKLK